MSEGAQGVGKRYADETGTRPPVSRRQRVQRGPGTTCRHREYRRNDKRGHCGEMACPNYVEKCVEDPCNHEQ
jgi:hypothetical protein